MWHIRRKTIFLILGPLLAFPVYHLLLSSTGSGDAAKMGALAIWMATWWITEAVSLYITALLPLVLFPFWGVVPMKEVAPYYTNEIIFLFIGGFILSFGIEKWNLHRCIALKILSLVGKSPAAVLLGFSLSGFLLSMWISNIATTMMLLPAVLSVMTQMEEQYGDSGKKLGIGLLLGLAYSSSIGGTATLVGTAPNMIFMGFYNDNFGTGEINFTTWLLFGLPVALVFFAAAFFVLKWKFVDKGIKITDPDYAARQYRELGPMTWPQRILLIIFGSVVFLWLFRSDLQIGEFRLRGWANFFYAPSYITDSTVAMLGAISLFLIPAGKKGKLLVWDDVRKLPLGVIFLFGGGFALAGGIASSGLGDWFAVQLQSLSGLDPFLLIVLLALFMTFFTELTSNTASTYLVLPILLSLSQSVDLPPVLVMLPVVFSASFAFMLPVATPPNTIVFGSEKVSIQQMMRTGFILNMIGVVLISLAVYFLGPLIFSR